MMLMSPRTTFQSQELVDRGPPQDSTDTGDPRVALVDRVPGTEVLSADDHRTQLQDLEVLAIPADAGLPIEDRPSALRASWRASRARERPREDEPGTGHEHVGDAVQRVPLALSHVCGVPARRYETSAATVAFVTT